MSVGSQAGNLGFGQAQAYVPALVGTTDNPNPTYTTQFGRWFAIGSIVFFRFVLITSTMTKTTLTDLLNITLPTPAATIANDINTFKARIENATAVANGIEGAIASGASVATFRTYGGLAVASAAITYGATAPGIGVLTNTITFTGEGYYEAA